MMNYFRGIVGTGLVAIALSIFALPSQSAYATECVMPEACSNLAAKAAANFGATDPADYIKTWMFVNCDAQGYFHGAMLNYNNCLATKSLEESAEKKRLQEIEKKRVAQERLNKLFTTRLEFGKDVKAGDVVKAKRNETLIITYADGAEVRLLPGATMKLTSYETVDLIRGKAMFMVNYLDWIVKKKRKQFEVRCSGGAGAVRGTKFYVDAKGVSATFKVIEGIVEVSNPKGDKKVEVNAGYSVVARKTGKISTPKAFDAEKLAKDLGIVPTTSE